MWVGITQSGRPNCAPIPEEKAPRSRRGSKNLNGERIRPGQPVSGTRSVRKSPCRIRKALQVHQKGRHEGNAIEAFHPSSRVPFALFVHGDAWPRIVLVRSVPVRRGSQLGLDVSPFGGGKGIAEVCFHVGIRPRGRGRGVRPVHSRGGWSVGYVAFCVRGGCRPSRY